MKIRIIDKRLGISGNNLEFKNESFFGLNVGDKVSQIGDGTETGTFRTDNFVNPAKYVGSIMIQFEKLEKMFAFKPQIETELKEEIYFIYGSTGSEVFTEAKNYVRFYKPIFK